MLPKKARIVKSQEIKAVIHRGKLLHSSPLLRIFSDGGGGSLARFALVASKHLGGAVVRNRIRRRILGQIQNIRHNINKLCDYVIILRGGGLLSLDSRLLRQELERAFK